MTALLEYLDLLRDAWEAKLGAKLLHAKQIERSLLTYLTRLIVLYVYPGNYIPLQVRQPGLSGPSRTIACWLRDAYKTITMELKIKSSTIIINTQEPSFSGYNVSL